MDVIKIEMDDFGGMEDFGLGSNQMGTLDRLSASPKDLSFGSPKFNTLNDFSGERRDSTEGPAVGLPAFDLGPSLPNMRMNNSISPMANSIQSSDNFMPASMDGGHGMDLMEVMGHSMPMVPLAVPGAGGGPPHVALFQHTQKRPETASSRSGSSKSSSHRPSGIPRASHPVKRKGREPNSRPRSEAAIMQDEDKKVSKRPWSKEEDDKVLELVAIHGAKNWPIIAGHLEGRVGKQCRERCAQQQYACPDLG